MSQENPTLDERRDAVELLLRQRDLAYQTFREWDYMYEQARNALWVAEESEGA